ncbi:MAG: hypothetical protein WAL66_12365, partial [Nitrososphaeraceae archaeon]
IMMAVNSGLSETRLGELYLKLTNQDIENTGCKIGFTQNAAELALREGKKYKIGMPMVTTIYHLRKISQELYEFGSISNTTKNDIDITEDKINEIQGIRIKPRYSNKVFKYWTSSR